MWLRIKNEHHKTLDNNILQSNSRNRPSQEKTITAGKLQACS